MRLKILILAIFIGWPLVPSAAEKKKPVKPTKKAAMKAKSYADFPRLLTARELLAIGPVKRQEYFENLRGMLNELDKMAFLKLGRLVASLEEPTAPEMIARYPAFYELFQYLIPAAHASECANPRYPFSVGPLCGALCAARGTGNDETGRAVGNVYFCFPRKDYQAWAQKGGYTAQLQLSREEYDALNVRGSWDERKPKLIELQRQKAVELISANIDREDAEAGKVMRQRLREAEISENIDREDAEAGKVMRQRLREAEISENIDREDAEAGKVMRQRLREAEISENIDREDAEAGKVMRQRLREAEIAENIDREDAEAGASIRRERERQIAENIDREDAEAGKAIRTAQQEAREREISENIDREDAQAGESIRQAQSEAEKQKRIAEREKLIADNQDREEADAGAAMRKMAEESKLREQTRVTQGPTPEKGLADGKCSPAKLSCTDRDEYLKKSHKGALKTFRAAKPVNCVNAGNMSQYAGNEVKAGNCGVVRDFCIRKDDCSKPPADNDGFKTRYSCPKGQAICSPFIYGLESKQKGICVAQKGRHLTEACDDKAKALKGKAGYVGDFIAQAPPGVAEAWDEYATAFNDTCKQKTESQDAHCLECGVIGRRLQEARALASGSCTDALGYKQMRPGAGAPPATAQ